MRKIIKEELFVINGGLAPLGGLLLVVFVAAVLAGVFYEILGFNGRTFPCVSNR